MENKQKEQAQKELNLNELEKVNGGLVIPVDPDDEAKRDRHGRKDADRYP